MTLEKILPRTIEDEMRSSYIDYSMSVIISRALPDVRDGLKPVHRRVLYGMYEQGLFYNKRYVKSARAVGHVMANYHPHGDLSIYNTIVRMVQPFSLRYPMIDGQGNFGSVDGDNPAAMRYTEVRLARMAGDALEDLDKDTVAFVDNFDGAAQEPTVLPSRLPQLLINGSSGIAVGMATNIPPHNITEVVNACIAYINNPDCELIDLVKHISGPDFPTAGIIYGRRGIQEAYATGNGSIIVRGRAVYEEDENRIIINEIPYQVNKTALLERIAELVREKRVEGISDMRDESDRDGMRIVIELKRDAQWIIVLNQLYKHSQLQTSFGINMLALVNNRPRVLNLKEMIHYFIEHRHEVVMRRTQFDLRKAEARAHIVEGLRKAVDHIDEIVAIIRQAGSPDEARANLIARFSFSELQANAILDLQLRRLTGLERDKLEREFAELMALIERLKQILSSRQNIMAVVKDELLAIREQYGDARRSEIIEDEGGEFSIEELIPDEEMVITISHAGYIKRLPVDTYRSQRRGGRGITGMETKEEDFVEHLFIASTHDYILFFTDHGLCRWLKVYEIPPAGRTAKGKAIINLLEMNKDEKIRAYLPVHNFDEEHYIIFVTKNGTIKKSPLVDYSRPRRAGIIAIHIEEGDELIAVRMTDGHQQIVLATAMGQAIRLKESDVRPVGRNAIGVRGAKLADGDFVIGMVAVDPTRDVSLLTVTQNGYGKKSPLEDYRLIHRGGRGVINIKTSDRNGPVVSILDLDAGHDLMIITKNGVVIRMRTDNIREIGRNSQGVRLINLDEGDAVIDITLVEKQDSEEEPIADTVPTNSESIEPPPV